MSEKQHGRPELIKKIRVSRDAMANTRDELLACRVAPPTGGVSSPFDELVQEARLILDKALGELDGVISGLAYFDFIDGYIEAGTISAGME